MNRLRRALGEARADDGLTLTELIMGMAITALTLALIGGFFATVMRLTTDDRNTRNEIGVASNAIDELDRVVRAGAPVPQPSGTQQPAVVSGSSASALTLIAYVDVDPATPVPSKVAFTVDARSNLVETRTLGVASGKYWQFTGLTTTRTIAGPVAVSFAYRADAGDGSAPTAITPADDASALKVTSISITVTTPKASASDVPVKLTTTALMPNTDLG